MEKGGDGISSKEKNVNIMLDIIIIWSIIIFEL